MGYSKRFLLVVTALMSACTVKQTQAPPLMGPSELATSITVYANPDRLTQDGSSQSAITVIAIGPNGRVMSGLTVRLSMEVQDRNGNFVPQDFGTLQARTLVTGTDGRAITNFTAPSPSPSLAGGDGTTVSVVATTIGTDAITAARASALIRLVPTGVILPPAGTPAPRFTFAPASPTANSPVAFDASSSCPENATATGCQPSSLSITSYNWNFGDGQTGSGPTPTHAFRSPGPYTVTLTVSNDRGLTASTTNTVPVGAGTPPTANFVFSPSAPTILQDVSFNAALSTAAPGHSIVSYAWDFGDGATKSGVTTTHDFGIASSFNVVLTVTDEAGQRGTTTRTVTVGTAVPPSGSAPPTAQFVFSPTAPLAGQSVSFNATASTAAAGHSIVSYSWNFGDGATGEGVTPTHAFAAVGTYNVVLAVTDDTGQRGVATQSITVGGTPPPAATSPIASFVSSPVSPAVNQDVFFNASSSTAATGRTIVSYSWDFGDGAAASGISPTHAFARAGTFTVSLVVTDDAGQTGTTSRTVTVASASGQIVADFTFSPTNPSIVLGTNTVFFDATPSSSSSAITSYVWDFGDGSASGSGLKPSHTYTRPATYVVRLTVTDSIGRSATMTKTVTVSP